MRTARTHAWRGFSLRLLVNGSSAKASLVPWMNRMGTETVDICSGRPPEGFPGACSKKTRKTKPTTLGRGLVLDSAMSSGRERFAPAMSGTEGSRRASQQRLRVRWRGPMAASQAAWCLLNEGELLAQRRVMTFSQALRHSRDKRMGHSRPCPVRQNIAGLYPGRNGQQCRNLLFIGDPDFQPRHLLSCGIFSAFIISSK